MSEALSVAAVHEPVVARPERIDLDDPSLDDETLLRTRICRLDLKIETSHVAPMVRRLHRELQKKGLAFRPLCYLGDEWGCPDEVPAIGIPFYLAHRRLLSLERREMLTVEGSGQGEFMRLLRHEAGHAFNYAFSLFEREDWQFLFGSFGKRYPERYRALPYSRRFVRHLGKAYAQRHPDEDFSETFAVWLTPGLNWRRIYRGTGALKKLHYVEDIAEKFASRKCPVPRYRDLHGHIERLRMTLESFYRRRRKLMALDLPDAHDKDMMEIFSTTASRCSAAAFIDRRSRRLVDCISHWTGEPKHVIRPLVRLLITRARNLGLKLRSGGEEEAVRQLLAYLTTLTMNYAYYGRYLVET